MANKRGGGPEAQLFSDFILVLNIGFIPFHLFSLSLSVVNLYELFGTYSRTLVIILEPRLTISGLVEVCTYLFSFCAVFCIVASVSVSARPDANPPPPQAMTGAPLITQQVMISGPTVVPGGLTMMPVHQPVRPSVAVLCAGYTMRLTENHIHKSYYKLQMACLFWLNCFCFFTYYR